MENNTQKIIEEKMAKLPEYIKTALAKIDWGSEILNIGRKHGLHIDEMGILQTETVMVLVGLVHPDEYSGNLHQELHLPKDKIDAIVIDVNEKIFKNIRQALIDFITTQDEAENNLEESIFKKTGIEIEPEKEITSEPMLNNNAVVGIAEKSILENSGVEVEENTKTRPNSEDFPSPDRNQILESIEHPQKGESVQFSNLVKSKLSSAVINEPEKTKYEDKKPTTSNDPYREPIN